jgi:polyhydroxybutyrate depolymerase
MKMIYFSVGILILLAIASLFLYTYRWNLLNPNKKHSFTMDGLNRRFVYHVPKRLNESPALIIAYHGTRMPAELMQVFTGHELDQLADESGNAIIVYPQGYKNNWNDCRKDAPYPARTMNLDDVGFTENIIAWFRENYKIDTGKVFVMGFSNGGQMVMKLARHKPALFKGFAVISANLPVEANDACTDAGQPISMLLINGMKDPIVPYNGGTVWLDGVSWGEVLSTEGTIQHWLELSKFNVTASSQSRIDYYSPLHNRKISLVKVLDGGHTIPNKNFRIPISKMGYMSKQEDVPKLAWDFFMGL